MQSLCMVCCDQAIHVAIYSMSVLFAGLSQAELIIGMACMRSPVQISI
jgi:hypothetical protein